MEAVEAIASVSQLLSYSFSANKHLLHVAKDIGAGPSAHRHRVDHIRQLDLLIENFVKDLEGFSVMREDVLIPLVIHVPVTERPVTGAERR